MRNNTVHDLQAHQASRYLYDSYETIKEKRTSIFHVGSHDQPRVNPKTLWITIYEACAGLGSFAKLIILYQSDRA